jgi:antitoxin component YwqK of YwqJK toxin-antitoxin module
MLSRPILAPLCGFLLLALSACNPIGIWREWPLHPNARVEVFNQLGKPISEREWRNRKKHGLWREYYENSTIKSESSFSHGIEHGAWAAWHSNGQKSFAATYNQGLRHGRLQRWNEQGELTEDSEWKDGVKAHAAP